MSKETYRTNVQSIESSLDRISRLLNDSDFENILKHLNNILRKNRQNYSLLHEEVGLTSQQRHLTIHCTQEIRLLIDNALSETRHIIEKSRERPRDETEKEIVKHEISSHEIKLEGLLENINKFFSRMSDLSGLGPQNNISFRTPVQRTTEATTQRTAPVRSSGFNPLTDFQEIIEKVKKARSKSTDKKGEAFIKGSRVEWHIPIDGEAFITYHFEGKIYLVLRDGLRVPAREYLYGKFKVDGEGDFINKTISPAIYDERVANEYFYSNSEVFSATEPEKKGRVRVE